MNTTHVHTFARVMLTGERAREARQAGVRSVSGYLPQNGYRCPCGAWDTEAAFSATPESAQV